MQKHDVLLCIWLSERTYANLFSRLQLTSQLYYHIDVINVWLTYLSNGIHLLFSMSCDYIFIAGTCFLSALCPFLFLLFRSFFSFLHPHPPLCLSRPSPTPPTSLFAEVAVTAVTLTKYSPRVFQRTCGCRVCVCFFFLVCKCVRLLRTQRPSVCVSLLQRARTYVCRCCCLCHATVLCSVLRYPLTFFITCSLVHLVSAYVIPPPPHLPLLVPSLMFAPSSLSLSLIVKHMWLEYWGANHYAMSTAQCSGRMSILPPLSVFLCLSLPSRPRFPSSS